MAAAEKLDAVSVHTSGISKVLQEHQQQQQLAGQGPAPAAAAAAAVPDGMTGVDVGGMPVAPGAT
jgi:hypothetical protein